jgi:hypothetical protein
MLDRESLEMLALESVCACRYYDLADYLDITTNAELLSIIDGEDRCHNCDGIF